jgi:uncharacterized Zn finger protein (UPF0148 family)
MSNVNCSDCGCELPDVNSGPCPNCGSTAKTVQVQAHSQGMATASAKTSLRKTVTAVKHDWKLICITSRTRARRPSIVRDQGRRV